ncbi:MAG: aldo/keto reductase [Anaerolineae bacterium]|nr:aldo/keto reductase [Anaerolineae bacterium]
MREELTLGKTDIWISPIGFGLMQWADYKTNYNESSNGNDVVSQMYHIALQAGINLFDTAEAYGNGRSELLLGDCLRRDPQKIIVATKFMPYPWRLNKRELRSALIRSLSRLGLDHIDLYQMHWPFPPISIPTWMEAMASVVKEGLVRSVGVSNYSVTQTQLAFDTLAKYNIPLASNQVKFNLLDQRPIQSGLVELCSQLGITIIAYSPLEKGLLTGKYTTERLPRGLLSWRYNKSMMVKISPLLNILQEVSDVHDNTTPGQVALNWLVCKGAVPIPGARNLKQANENAGAMLWSLTDDEVDRLDNAYHSVYKNG